jgi:hypothetical protein
MSREHLNIVPCPRRAPYLNTGYLQPRGRSGEIFDKDQKALRCPFDAAMAGVFPTAQQLAQAGQYVPVQEAQIALAICSTQA